jgi:SAM-dependent methyltransferase
MATISPILRPHSNMPPEDLAHRLGFWSKYAFVDSALVHTALRLGLFERLPIEGDAPIEVADLARRFGASERGMRVLCEPLAASGVLASDTRGRLAVPFSVATQLRAPALTARLSEARKWWYAARRLAHVIRDGPDDDRNGQRLLARYSEQFLRPAGVSTDDGPLLDRAARNYLRTAALMAANELGVFDALGTGWQRVEALAQHAECAVDRFRILLRTLATLWLVELDDNFECARWSPAALECLGGRQLAAFRQGLTIAASFWGALGQLTAAVIEDRRVLDLQDPQRSAAFYLALARYNTVVFPAYFRLARRVSATIDQVQPLAKATVLDVGSGSGVWGTAFLRSAAEAACTFLDRAQVLDQTRRVVERLVMTDRVQLWPEDILAADFGVDRYDVVLLGQICHTQPPEVLPGLFRRLAAALQPGGCLVLADCILDEHRRAPLEYLYFGVKEFTSTRGDVLSQPEYERLLSQAGFQSMRLYRPGGVDVLLASRDARSWPTELASAEGLFS